MYFADGFYRITILRLLNDPHSHTQSELCSYDQIFMFVVFVGVNLDIYHVNFINCITSVLGSTIYMFGTSMGGYI